MNQPSHPRALPIGDGAGAKRREPTQNALISFSRKATPDHFVPCLTRIIHGSDHAQWLWYLWSVVRIFDLGNNTHVKISQERKPRALRDWLRLTARRNERYAPAGELRKEKHIMIHPRHNLFQKSCTQNEPTPKSQTKNLTIGRSVQA